MWQTELYDRRYDWLVASLLAIPLIWVFYGFNAAFLSCIAFLLSGALKPLAARLGSQLAAGVFAAGIVLLFSPLLRFVFYTGYCFEGNLSPGAGISRYLAPNLCRHGLFAALDQDIWVGPLRDLAMPIAGFGLMVLSWLDPKQAMRQAIKELEAEQLVDASASSRSKVCRLANWSGLGLALAIWAISSFLNYRDMQEALARQRSAELAEIEREARAEAVEAKKRAADLAAKRVELKWLLGSWAPLDGLDKRAVRDSRVYCGTDNGIKFGSDKRYHAFLETGTFQLKNNKITLTNRVQIDEWQETSETLEPVSRSVERNGQRLIIEGSPYGRC